MAAKKKRATRKKTARKKAPPKKRPSTLANLFKSGIGILLLAAAVVAGGFIASRYLPPAPERKAPARVVTQKATPPASRARPASRNPTKTKSVTPAKTAPPPRFEVYPKELETADPPELPTIDPAEKKPRVAIIVDDMGYDRALAAKFLSLDVPLTLAILPHSPHQKKIADMAHDKGCEVMLHLPMEPVEYPQVQPGPGALLTSMAPDRLIAQLQENLRLVPHVTGVNNHMGSRMTPVSSQMNQIFSVLKKRGLFFIDSRTTRQTVARSSARLLQVPFAERDVFLDHVSEADFIRKQVRRLLSRAGKKGEAVGIAHPSTLTWTILKESLPQVTRQVQLVPASRIVRILG